METKDSPVCPHCGKPDDEFVSAHHGFIMLAKPYGNVCSSCGMDYRVVATGVQYNFSSSKFIGEDNG